MSNWINGWFNREPDPEPTNEPTTWNDLTRATFQSGWATVQFTGPEIAATRNQNGAFSVAMLQEYQRFIIDARNRIADNMQFQALSWQGNPIDFNGGWKTNHASKPPLHDAWLMEDQDL